MENFSQTSHYENMRNRKEIADIPYMILDIIR